jgi:hypothetical protein
LMVSWEPFRAVAQEARVWEREIPRQVSFSAFNVEKDIANSSLGF